MDKQADLISRLQDEADLCRNDGATDIAALLDEAVQGLRTHRAAIYSAEQAQIEAPLRAEIERLRAEVKALRKLWDEAEAENDAMRAVNRARLLGA